MKVLLERYLVGGGERREVIDVRGATELEAAIRSLAAGDDATDAVLELRVGRWDLLIGACKSRYGVSLRSTSTELGDDFSSYGLTERLHLLVNPSAPAELTEVWAGGLLTQIPVRYVVTADDAVAVARTLVETGTLPSSADRWEVEHVDADAGAPDEGSSKP